MSASAAIQAFLLKNLKLNTDTENFKVTNNKNNKNNKNNNKISKLTILFSIINWIIFFLALYLSFKCNKGFDLSSFLIACCCAPFYVIYRIVVPC